MSSNPPRSKKEEKEEEQDQGSQNFKGNNIIVKVKKK